MSMEVVGKVKAVNRYPVKSMGGESLATATLRWPGIDGDRQYAFYRAGSGSRFPWLTGREISRMVTYAARYIEPENPRHSGVRVVAEEGEQDIRDPGLLRFLSQAAGEEIRLLQVGRGTFDSMPVSVLSTSTLAQLDERIGRPVEPERFRANILVDTGGIGGVRETDWVGGTLVFGSAPDAPRLRANVPIDRCVMITIDPADGTRDARILRRVVEDFANEIGVRCATDRPGTIRVGNDVWLLRSG
jgi:uncharacterized protein YcbX